MTIREFFSSLDAYALQIALVSLGLVLFPVALRALHSKGNGARKPWRYLYSALVFTVCIPGVFSLALTGYALLFTGENLMDMSVLAFALAPMVMVGSLVLSSKFVDLDEIPGFDRIQGLMVLLGLTFVIVLLLSRLQIHILSWASWARCSLWRWGSLRCSSGPQTAPLGLAARPMMTTTMTITCFEVCCAGCCGRWPRRSRARSPREGRGRGPRSIEGERWGWPRRWRDRRRRRRGDPGCRG